MDTLNIRETSLYNIFPNEYYMDIMLYQHGFERCVPCHSYGPAVRNHYLFHFILSGTGTLYATTRDGMQHEFHLHENQGFLIVPNQITTYIADEETPWEYAWVEFDGAKAKEWMNQAGLTGENPVYNCNDTSALPSIRNELLTLVTGEETSSIFQLGHFYLYMDQLLHTSAGFTNTPSGNLKDFYIRQAVSYIEQNFSDPITINDLAMFCNLNRSYLGKLFKDALGKTPQQFLIYYRMKQATQMLCYTNMTIGEIAKSVGYPNQLHFSRAFKNVYQMSPSQWKQTQLKNNEGL